MKRLYAVYAASLLVLLLVAILGVRLSIGGGVDSALRDLARSEREYQQARRRLLMSARNPMPKMFAFVADTRNKRRARLRALEILGELAFVHDADTLGRHLIPVLRDTALDIRLQALKTLENFATYEGSAEVATIFHTASDSALIHQSYLTLKAAAEKVEGSLATALSSSDSAAIDSCIALLDPLPARKGVMYHRLARYYRGIGDIEQASAYYRRMGILKKWWVTGGFVNERMAGFHKDYGPESRPFNPADSFAVDDTTKVGWFKLERVEPTGMIDLKRLFVRQTHSVAYLFTYVHAPEDTEARLYIGSDDGPRVWCNGTLVWSNEQFRGCFPDDDVASLPLKKGVNELLVKVSQEMGGWNVITRVGDTDGRGIEGLYASLTPEVSGRAVERMLEEKAGGATDWSRMADSLDGDDRAAVQAVVTALVDEGRGVAVRLAAATLLGEINKRRLVPAGETSLLEYASKAAAQRTRGNAVLGAIADLLVEMGTGKALDIGIAMRDVDDPRMQLHGNRLVDSYCRSRIKHMGDMRQMEREAEMQRMVNDIESLRPTGAWVLERLASHYRKIGDSAKTGLYERRIAIPSVWMFRTLSGAQSLETLPDVVTKADMTAGTLAKGEAADGWTRVGSPGARQAFVDIEEVCRGNEKAVCVLVTAVEARSDMSALAHLSLPAAASLWLNGRRVLTTDSSASARYEAGEAYQWQPRELDAHIAAVELRKGENTVALVFRPRWFSTGVKPYCRLAFSTPEGVPLGCDGHVVAAPAAE